MSGVGRLGKLGATHSLDERIAPRSNVMTAYAIARLSNVRMGAEIKAYLAGIDDTLRPFEGQFVIHGGKRTVVEGQWNEDVIAIAFPDLDHARSWYESSAYQRLLPLRTRNSVGDVILIDGVSPGHQATDILTAA
ncbi:DUF1330 domain-containing protein [Trinickia soli]